MMHPYVVSSADNNGHVTSMQPQILRRVISSKTAQQLDGMLLAAANYNRQATIPGYSVAVKNWYGYYSRSLGYPTEASMAGFLPASNPQFVILVKLDRPQASIFGGAAAGPLWKLIAQDLMSHYNVPPIYNNNGQ